MSGGQYVTDGDLTGNARIVVPEPGFLSKPRAPPKTPIARSALARSLRGPKAGRIVRALIDGKRPLGARELASVTKVGPATVQVLVGDLAAIPTQVLVILRLWEFDSP